MVYSPTRVSETTSIRVLSTVGGWGVSSSLLLSPSLSPSPSLPLSPSLLPFTSMRVEALSWEGYVSLWNTKSLKYIFQTWPYHPCTLLILFLHSTSHKTVRWISYYKHIGWSVSEIWITAFNKKRNQLILGDFRIEYYRHTQNIYFCW